MIETEFFNEYAVLALKRAPHGDAGTTFACQLHTDSMANIDLFEASRKDEFDAMIVNKYGQKCLSFITVLEKQ